MSDELGAKIVEIRKKSGLGSQRDACKLLGVSVNTLWSYENGKSLPDVDFLARLSQLSGTDFLELVRVRLEAGGENPEILEVRDDHAGYGSLHQVMLSEQPGLGGIEAASALRAELRRADISVEWALLLMQLVTSGDLRAEGARAIIEFLQAKEE